MEEVLQFVWRYRLWSGASLRTDCGQRVTVIDAGEQNHGSGPDFFNAKLLIDGEMWVGNVEIHNVASDWYRHGHDTDPAYDSVVLHVVAKSDRPVLRVDGRIVPQAVITWSDDALRRYNEMVSDPLADLPCARDILSVPRVYMADWLTALGMQRLQRKADDVMQRVDSHAGDWQEAIYITLARALGFGTNAEPMERLARAVPLKRLLSKRDDMFAVDGLLVGMSGMLADSPRDAYEQRLTAEFRFLTHKFGLTPPDPAIQWQLKVRPQNSPLMRVAALGAFVVQGFGIGRRILGLKNVADTEGLFDVGYSPYWSANSAFGRPRPVAVSRAVSAASAQLLTINVAAPVVYAYGMAVGDDRRMELAVDILNSLKPENNTATRLFAGAGIDVRGAFDGQACLQLRNEYCQRRKCLFCRIGRQIINGKRVAPFA